MRKRKACIGACQVSNGRMRTASKSVSVGSTCHPVNVASSPPFPATLFEMRAYVMKYAMNLRAEANDKKKEKDDAM